MTQPGRRWKEGAAAGAVLAAALSGCAEGQSAAQASSPAFAGPWADELERMTSLFESEFAARAFADGVVTEQEMLEGRRLLEDCYSAAGLTAAWDEYGRVAVDGAASHGDTPPDAMGRCAFADGGVLVMYYEMLMNPEREDDWVIRARCLVDRGLVGPGFTGQELQRLFDAEDAMPWDVDDPVARRCMDDPLAVVEQEA